MVVFENQYNRKFEVVDKMPEGSVVWNIRFESIDNGNYIPFCYEIGNYNIDVNRLYALDYKKAGLTEEEVSILKHGTSYYGFSSLENTMKKYKKYRKNDAIDTAVKCVEIFKKIS